MNTNSDSPENPPTDPATNSAADAASNPAADGGTETGPLENRAADHLDDGARTSAAGTGAAPAAAPPAAPTAEGTAPAAPRRRRVGKRTLWIGGVVAGVLALGGAGIAIADELGESSDALDATTRDRIAAAATASTDGGELIDAERDDDGGYDAEIRLENGTEVDVHFDDEFAVESSERDDDDRSDDGTTDERDAGTDGTGTDGTTGMNGTDADDVPLTADETTAASEAALAETGGGEVVDVDRSDDRDHAFEVEVRREDGTAVDVRLDADFTVVGTSPSD